MLPHEPLHVLDRGGMVHAARAVWTLPAQFVSGLFWLQAEEGRQNGATTSAEESLRKARFFMGISSTDEAADAVAWHHRGSEPIGRR